jgi:hypothetical protein
LDVTKVLRFLIKLCSSRTPNLIILFKEADILLVHGISFLEQKSNLITLVTGRSFPFKNLISLFAIPELSGNLL